MGSAVSPATRFLAVSLVSTALMEIIAVEAVRHMGILPLRGLAITRTLQILGLIGLSVIAPHGLETIGLTRALLGHGIRKGLIWSTGFALIAGLGMICLFAGGVSPLSLIRVPLPAQPEMTALFFLVGGVIAPVAEEIVFRGIIFSYLKKWGTGAAVVLSTALFTAFHTPSGPPVFQIVGGVVFSISFYKSGSLITPILIHSLGNLALFTLSLPFFH